MNNKFRIITSLTFVENNLDDASKMLNQEISDSVLPQNGELSEMNGAIGRIILKANQFKKLLAGVKALDNQRRGLVEKSKEIKNEEA